MDRGRRAGREQLVMDHADAAAHVEHGRTAYPFRLEQVEQETRRPVRALGAIALQVLDGVLLVELRRVAFTVAAGHIDLADSTISPTTCSAQSRRG